MDSTRPKRQHWIQYNNNEDCSMFPKNAWYVACTPDEIDGKPLGRMICNERMVIYRGPANVSRPWRTSAPTAARRCPLDPFRTASWCAATTAW